MLVRFDAAGELMWYERFRSSKRMTTLHATLELEDGAFAMTGSTRARSGAHASRDRDGFLLVIGPRGQGLQAYRSCLADARQLHSMHTEFEALTGIRITRPLPYRTVRGPGAAPAPAREASLNRCLSARLGARLIGFSARGDAVRETVREMRELLECERT